MATTREKELLDLLSYAGQLAVAVQRYLTSSVQRSSKDLEAMARALEVYDDQVLEGLRRESKGSARPNG